MNTVSTTSIANQADRTTWSLGLSLLLTVLPFLAGAPAAAQQAPTLGSAVRFAVLGGSTVTNIGPSAITGDVGVSPGTAITGFPPATVTGTIHAGGAVAAQAQADATIAYNALVGAACTTVMTGQDLGGLTLTPGVYCFATSAQLTGTLTLEALGNANAVFIFQIGSTLTTAPNSAVNLSNGADACRVFWQVGSSATLGTTTAFAGTIIALTSVTMNTGASMSGRAIARTGAVTLDSNVIGNPSMASWSNYGVGWPGTFGVPSLVLSALPVIGTTPNMVVQNVYTAPTYGLLLWGSRPVTLPTLFGGTLLVQTVHWWSVPIGTGSHAMPMAIPLDVSLICMDFY
ncbi:MAG: ice-binding family protein, partial [Planctomycetota bacterium]|nr:ice-binding family protein [Planctomycetota bacterium]